MRALAHVSSQPRLMAVSDNITLDVTPYDFK